MHAQSLSHALLFVIPWTVASQAPLPMGFSRQEYWSGLPFPSPGDLPDLRIELTSPALARGFAGEYQADEQAGVARLRWQVSGR